MTPSFEIFPDCTGFSCGKGNPINGAVQIVGHQHRSVAHHQHIHRASPIAAALHSMALRRRARALLDCADKCMAVPHVVGGGCKLSVGCRAVCSPSHTGWLGHRSDWLVVALRSETCLAVPVCGTAQTFPVDLINVHQMRRPVAENFTKRLSM